MILRIIRPSGAFIYLLIFLLQPFSLFSRTNFTNSQYTTLAFTNTSISQLFKQFDKIPVAWRAPVIAALNNFPELQHTHIIFRVRHVRSPLSTRPSWWSLLKRKNNRLYIVTISDSTIPKLSPILFKYMQDDARTGVAGHELSHVADFCKKNIWQMLRVGFGHLSNRYVDRFEFKTDSICIRHGLGYQLLAWSIFVRKALHLSNWEGSDHIGDHVIPHERYMNPSTIERKIREGN